MRTPRATGRTRRRLLVRLGRTASFTCDVSRGGFCLGLMSVLAEGTAVAGSILLAGEEFAFAGRVAWARPGDRHLGLAGRMGVTFTDLASAFDPLIDPAGAARPAAGACGRKAG